MQGRAPDARTGPLQVGRHYRRGVLRWLCASVVGAVVTWFSLLLITGHYIDEGPVLVEVSTGHGVHTGDIVVVALWAVSILSLVVLTVMPAGARSSSTSPSETIEP